MEKPQVVTIRLYKGIPQHEKILQKIEGMKGRILQTVLATALEAGLKQIKLEERHSDTEGNVS